MCAHNGTHADAPRHFYKDGMAIDQMELSKFIGYCTVVNFERVQDKNKLKTILENCENKLLLKGYGTVTLDMAKLLNQYQIQLIGVESQSVGEVNAPMDVHLELLGKEVVILEGLRLGEVPEGNYLLSAAPLKLGESDGAPCRAVLIELE
jgi:arylformamidase